MKLLITVLKLINEMGADERAGTKGLPSHLKSEYGIFDNQRDGWARDPNRIKGRSQSAMPPEMKHQEGSVMKFVNKNKISGSLLHYNLISREQKINHFDSWSLSLSNSFLTAYLTKSVTDVNSECFFKNSSTWESKEAGNDIVLYPFTINDSYSKYNINILKDIYGIFSGNVYILRYIYDKYDGRGIQNA